MIEEFAFLYLQWLQPDDLGCAGICSQGLNHESRRSSLWKDLVEARFRLSVSKHRPKLYGASDWMQAYHNMSYEIRIPRDRFTRNIVIFAKGRLESAVCDAWVLLAHRADHRTRRPDLSCGDAWRDTAIELRVVVQNIKADLVWLDQPTSTRVLLTDEDGENLISKSTLTGEHYTPHPIYTHRGIWGDRKKGIDSNADTRKLLLPRLAYAVYSMWVQCPAECMFEPDFLVRARFLDLDLHCLMNQEVQSKTVRARFMDESSVWNHYEELPGGFMVLKERGAKLFE